MWFTDGGKLQLWDMNTSSLVCDESAHEDRITVARVSAATIHSAFPVLYHPSRCSSPPQMVDNHVYTASYDGDAQVFQVTSERALRRLFRCETRRHRFGGNLIERPILSLNVDRCTLYIGDDGVNVKALNWKDGAAHA